MDSSSRFPVKPGDPRSLSDAGIMTIFETQTVSFGSVPTEAAPMCSTPPPE